MNVNNLSKRSTSKKFQDLIMSLSGHGKKDFMLNQLVITISSAAADPDGRFTLVQIR